MLSGRRALCERMARAFIVAHAPWLLAGCPADNHGTTTGEPPSTCAKAGSSCSFAKGKLGLCVVSVDGTSLLCQSQH
ncbi:MAG: hypothetical protein M3O50_14535 [Myxococcota bacterium]|nr:hypothetical protein [Myxococcota bacterium]